MPEGEGVQSGPWGLLASPEECLQGCGVRRGTRHREVGVVSKGRKRRGDGGASLGMHNSEALEKRIRMWKEEEKWKCDHDQGWV